ncbi:tetratricopeptide repeat protein [Balneola vulgaris]|uniref:tetratricopeptide repeat protein n=1 Tax=Balneola vulgaris TaxID=287535 RepID=UPI00036652D1|nr:tetratricopeptide repeat protein [Balneola vulgaris]
MRFIVLSCLLFTCILTFDLNAQYLQSARAESYQTGIELYNEGYFEEAVLTLNSFKEVNTNPELTPFVDFYLARSKASSDSARIEYYYHNFIRSYPKHELAKTLFKDLGHRYESMGQYDEAIEFYQRSLETLNISNTTAAETQYWVAEAAAEKKDHHAARSFFMDLADTYPNSDWAPKALYARGRLYLTDNKFDSASVGFEVLKERYPNAPITRRVGTALGESYYQQGRYEEAIEALRNAMFYLDEESKEKAVFLTAESYNFLGDYKEASKSYLQYLNMTKGTPKERNAHYGLGWLYHKQKIYHWAADSFAKATEGDDEIARKALYYKAINEKLGGQYENSLKSFREFGDRYTTGLWVEHAYYEWAVSSFEFGQYGEAIETLLTLIRNVKNLDNPGKVYAFLGEAYFANNEYTRASQAFEEAEKVADIDPNLRRQARFQKAWILYRNQAYEQAQPIFESVYAETPKSDIGTESLFWSADSYYKMGQYSEASQRFSIFIKNYPNHELIGAARYSLGWSYFVSGDYEKAVGPLEAFLNDYNPPPIALFPYDTDTQLRIGDSYYALGDYRNAIRFYNKAIGADPGGDYAMFQVANSYYRSGRTFEAVSTFRRVLRIYPFSRLREQAQYNVAYIYLNTDNYSQAIEEFQTVINKYPGTEWAARSQYNIGDSYYNAGEYDRAIEAYKQVLSKYPKSSYIIDAVNGIQFSQLSSTGVDSSSAVLEDFLSNNPSSSTADRLRYRQAENVYQSGDYEAAIKEFRQYLRITNSDNLIADAYTNLGDAYQQTGQIDQAINAYQTIVDEYPTDDQAPSALITLGNLYRQKGEFEASHQYFALLLERGTRYSQEAYVGMGTASLEGGDLGKAKSEFENALQINPANAAANVGLGRVALAEKRYDEATQLLRPIADQNTTVSGAEAQFYLGQIQQEQENFEQAIEEYSKVRVLFEAFETWVSRSLYHSAESHILLGNRAEALEILKGIVETYPDTEGAEKAQLLLDRTED